MMAPAFLPEASALVTISAPGRNTDPPTGALAGSGWEMQGFWGNFTGTPIGPHHFLTAKHVGGHIGDIFHFAGKEFRTVQKAEISGCDLAVWRVEQPLPRWAPLYDGGEETGKTFVAFGRGSAPAQPVTKDGCQQGWHCGPPDGKLSWGENRIEGVTVAESKTEPADLLAFDFDASSSIGPNECQVTAGDSGGGLFLQDEGRWKLAGILFGSVRTFRKGDGVGEFSGPSFEAAVSDVRGLYIQQKTGTFAYVSRLYLSPQPAVSYATRLSSYLPRIREAMAVPPAPIWVRLWWLGARLWPWYLGIGLIAAAAVSRGFIRFRRR